MEFIDVLYYVGLLSAAQYHGAAHHRPQQFQVVTTQKRRSITCGHIKMIANAYLNEWRQTVPWSDNKTVTAIRSIVDPMLGEPERKRSKKNIYSDL